MSRNPKDQRGDSPERVDLAWLQRTFESYGRPREAWLVGGEFERAVVRSDGSPLPYDGPDGIRWLLESLAELDPRWTIEEEAGKPIALERPDSSSITLEPGGQVELSGAPHQHLGALATEMQENRAALLQLCEGRNLRVITSGLTPVADIEDVPWMPKGRYAIMREYLPRHGDRAVYMMKGTCSVQANFDYADEGDCARKVRLCSGLGPLTTALFANSPLYKNQPTGFLSYRGHIWTRTDPARTGFPPELRAGYTHARWMDYLLDVPMMFYRREGRWTPAEGRSFRSWMNDGIDGSFPSAVDWSLHQTSVFPEVRVKRTIEVRGADCVSAELALGFCAWFVGLLYDEEALSAALALVDRLEQAGSTAERFDLACRDGLGAQLPGLSMAELAREVGAIARSGLSRVEPEALPMLEPLLDRVEAGRSPALDLLEAWSRDPRPEAVIEALRY